MSYARLCGKQWKEKQRRSRQALLATAAIVLMALLPAALPAHAFVFVHISDPHVNVSEDGRFRGEGLASLRRTLEAIRVVQPAFVIVTGDLTERSDEASFLSYRAAIDALDMPVYSIQGNHDGGRNVERFNRAVGATHLTFDHGGCRFVGINFDRGAEALDFLEAQLNDAREAGIAPVFTFAHYPLLAPENAAFSIARGFANITGERATRYLDLAQRHKIVAHFCGHLHSHFDIADPHTGVLSLAVPAVAAHNAYRVCSVRDGVLSWSIATAGEWPVAVLDGAQPSVQWSTARVEGKVTLRILTFGPHPVATAEVWLGQDKQLTAERDASGNFGIELDCTELTNSFQVLRARIADEANNQTERTWRLLIKGGE